MTHPPFAVLKLPLLLLLAALLLAAGGLLWGQREAKEAETALQQQQTALNQARQQLDRSRQQQRLIATHLGDYRTLVARGFVGAEDRLAWIEAVQLANRDAGLYGLNYRLMPRSASPSALAQGLPLGQTRMVLTLPLLVETDLTRFLDALGKRAPGLVRVQGCRLSRLDNVPFEATSHPHLQAECDLLWFTVGTAAEPRHD
jgi:type II secretory pathway pseudopilin PulG